MSEAEEQAPEEKASKRVSVEMFGYARRLAGDREAMLEMHPGGTMRDVVIALGRRYPSLVGPIIEPITYDLVSPFFLNVNGRHVVKDFDAEPNDGECLILFFVDAGG